MTDSQDVVLTAEQILAPRELPRERVTVPELGGSVFVRAMSGLERDAFEMDLYSSRAAGALGLRNMRARLAVRCVCDSKGKLLFTPDQADALGSLHGVALDRMFTAAQQVNGMGDKALKDIEGNSKPTLGDAQSSDSP